MGKHHVLISLHEHKCLMSGMMGLYQLNFSKDLSIIRRNFFKLLMDDLISAVDDTVLGSV